MSSSNRKATVTPEHRAEASALRALWEKRQPKLTQGAFGHDFGIGNQAAVWQFLHARVALSRKAAVGFANGLGCSVRDFSPRLADEIEDQARMANPQSLYVGGTAAGEHAGGFVARQTPPPQSPRPAARLPVRAEPDVTAAVMLLARVVATAPTRAKREQAALVLRLLGEHPEDAAELAETLADIAISRAPSKRARA